MAEPLTPSRGPGVAELAAWSDEAVKLGDVIAALAGLRRPESQPATHSSVLTLVIVAASRDRAARAQAAVHELGGRHPARVLTLVVDSASVDGPPGLDAELRLLGGEAEGQRVWFEDVELRVHGAAAGHLDSLIEPFTLPDLPVVAWFVDGLPAAGDPLLAAADVLLVDARHLGDAAAFATLVALTAQRPVVDLSWVRLKPWRQLLAGLFEGPAFGPFVHHVHRAEVWGKTGPRHLLGGWLAERLGLGPGSLHLTPADHVGMRLQARQPDGTQATFEVHRDDARVVRARAEVDGGPRSEAVLSLPDATPAWGLADALAHLGRDPVYDAALRHALPPPPES